MSVYGYRFVKSNYSDVNSTIDSSLFQLQSSITGLSNEISSFYNGASKILSGEAFEVLLNKLNLCNEACNFLANAIDV